MTTHFLLCCSHFNGISPSDWRKAEIYIFLKDNALYISVGHNYGLYSEFFLLYNRKENNDNKEPSTWWRVLKHSYSSCNMFPFTESNVLSEYWWHI